MPLDNEKPIAVYQAEDSLATREKQDINIAGKSCLVSGTTFLIGIGTGVWAVPEFVALVNNQGELSYRTLLFVGMLVISGVNYLVSREKNKSAYEKMGVNHKISALDGRDHRGVVGEALSRDN